MIAIADDFTDDSKAHKLWNTKKAQKHVSHFNNIGAYSFEPRFFDCYIIQAVCNKI